jgi:hypothetical protein
MALPYWCGKVRGKVIEVESKRKMTGRSLECALSNLPLALAYYTIVSLGAKTNYLAYISKHNSTSILFINEIFFNKNLTKTQFSSYDERNSTPRSSTFVVEPLIE